MCAQIKCLLAGDSSYTTDSLLYDEVVQQLIYECDSEIDEEMISKINATKCSNVDFASRKRDDVMR